MCACVCVLGVCVCVCGWEFMELFTMCRFDKSIVCVSGLVCDSSGQGDTPAVTTEGVCVCFCA